MMDVLVLPSLARLMGKPDEEAAHTVTGARRREGNFVSEDQSTEAVLGETEERMKAPDVKAVEVADEERHAWQKEVACEEQLAEVASPP